MAFEENSHDSTGGPSAIEVRGARVNNLRDLNIDVPLHRLVALTGLSGSGKSSLALGTLYAEGSRRYLEALSTYTRRRIPQAARPDVDSVSYLPSALALRQRPAKPGPRSTVGTLSEGLNILRLMFSRLGSHVCPNGHRLQPSLMTSVEQVRKCPDCSVSFEQPGAESFSFNSYGACTNCNGLGEQQEVDPGSLVPDTSLSLADGAVAPWRGPVRSNMPMVAREMGVRIDVPFAELSKQERDIVLHGPAEKHRIVVEFGKESGAPLNLTFENAIATVEKIASREDKESPAGSLRSGKYVVRSRCRSCIGTRLSQRALTSQIAGKNLAEVCAYPLTNLEDFAQAVLSWVPGNMRGFAERLVTEFAQSISPLLVLGLGYLSLDRAGSTLSTGELQRVQLAHTVLDKATGMLFVLDEPSIGLHPSNVAGLIEMMRKIVRFGNTLVVVDHDVEILDIADHLIEVGPRAGRDGGEIIAQGKPTKVGRSNQSIIGPYLNGSAPARVRSTQPVDASAHDNWLTIEVSHLFNLHDVAVRFPIRALTAVTGVSGAGKSALVLDSLTPALRASTTDEPRPQHVRHLDPASIRKVISVDATPIGTNARSTPATYSSVFDAIRTLFARTDGAKRRRWNAGRFSYNVVAGRCASCEGLGVLSLDVQYLPDVEVRCTDCDGRRYAPDTLEVHWQGLSIADVLELSVESALELFQDQPRIKRLLTSLVDVGIGYLTLGEPTPALSGGEAQRLRLASELRKGQAGTLFVFDEPSIGLHPRDIETLLQVFDRLTNAGATVIIIEHDLDMIANADWIVDLGPSGGDHGGRITASGTPEQLRRSAETDTGIWLNRHFTRRGVP